MTLSSLTRAARWPLWSWRNLTITSLVTLAVLAGVGRLTDAVGAAAAPARQPVASTAPTVPMGAPATTRPPLTSNGVGSSSPSSTATASSADQTSPVEVGGAFVKAWARPGSSETAWLAAMKPWATAELLSSMTGTDPTQVPATRVTGDVALRATKDGAATVSVPTDGGRIAVELVKQSGSWKANSLAPDDAPPGAPTPSLTSTTIGSGG